MFTYMYVYVYLFTHIYIDVDMDIGTYIYMHRKNSLYLPSRCSQLGHEIKMGLKRGSLYEPPLSPL